MNIYFGLIIFLFVTDVFPGFKELIGCLMKRLRRPYERNGCATAIVLKYNQRIF